MKIRPEINSVDPDQTHCLPEIELSSLKVTSSKQINKMLTNLKKKNIAKQPQPYKTEEIHIEIVVLP